MSQSIEGQSSNPTPTAPVQTQGLGEDDDISITTTVTDEEREYEVEEVVYQLPSQAGVTLYLVKWAGYDEMENTWEPESSFIDPQSLELWREKRDAISRGLKPEFDIDAWSKKKKEYDAANEVANAKRSSRRKAKRRRLGLSVSPSSNDSENIRSFRTRGRHGYLIEDSDDSDYISTGEQRSSRGRVRVSRDASLSSTDSLMNALRTASKRTGTDRQNLGKVIEMSKESPEPSHDRQKKQATPKKLGEGRLKKSDAKKPGEVATKQTKTPRKAVNQKAAAVTRQKEPIQEPPIPKATLTSLGPAKEVLAAAGIKTTITPIRKITGGVNIKSHDGAGKLAKRTGHSTQHTTAPGRDVLQNWTDKPKRRQIIKLKVSRPQSPEPKLYKNLAARRRAELRGRKEATPDINSLDLRLPGDYHRPPPKPLAPATNPSPTQLITDNLDSLFEDESLDNEGNAIQSDEEPLQFTPKSGNQEKSWPVVRDNNVDMLEADVSNDSPPLQVDSNIHIGSPVLTQEISNEQSITERNQSPEDSKGSPNLPPADPRSLITTSDYPTNRPVFSADLLGPVPPAPQAWAPFDISKQLSRTKHYFEPGDLLVTMRIFNKEVGQVRLRGLDKDSRHRVLRIKTNHEIDISLQCVLKFEDYKSLVRGRSNPTFSNGWVEGFDDTHAACDGFATFLRTHSLAAVWNHPHEDLALLIYHHGSSDWGFLDAATQEQFKTPLRVASRLKLPPLPSSTPPLHLLSSIPDPHTPSSIPPPPSSSLPEDIVTISNSIPLEGVTFDSWENEITTQDPRRNDLRRRTDVMATLNSQELDTVFRDQLGIDFSRITKLHGDNVVAEKFLLVFPTGTESEGQQFERFLRSHSTKKVFLDGDRLVKWKEFSTGNEPSCLILHASFPFIDRLPGLSGLLSKHIILWRVSVNSPIPYDENERYLIRIFPQGGAIFITEDLMLNDTDKALQIVRWFCRKYHPHRLPNTWKLVFRPAIREWLFDMAEQTKNIRFLEMRKEISDLIPPYPVTHQNAWIGPEEVEHLDGETDDDGQAHPFVSVRNIPKYGSRKEDDHRRVPKGMTQEERNKDHLMEWFAGWAIGHMEEFRKFTIISRLPHLERWKKWHHVKIQTPDEFANSWKSLGMTLGPDDHGSKI